MEAIWLLHKIHGMGIKEAKELLNDYVDPPCKTASATAASGDIEASTTGATVQPEPKSSGIPSDPHVLEGKIVIDDRLAWRYFRVRFSSRGLSLETGDLVAAPKTETYITRPLSIHETIPMRFEPKGGGQFFSYPKTAHLLEVLEKKSPKPILFHFDTNLGDFYYHAYPGEQVYRRAYMKIDATFSLQGNSVSIAVTAIAGPVRPVPKPAWTGESEHMPVSVEFTLPLELVPFVIASY